MTTSLVVKRFLGAGVALILIMSIGTIGYWFIGRGDYSFLNCFYMTFITVATIGYGEVIDLSHSPGGRVFTMFIALTGIGVLTYCLSMFTALVIEGELRETFKRKKMEKIIKKLQEHYIVCGMGRVGMHVVNELQATQRPHVIIDMDERKSEEMADAMIIKGDATDELTLQEAGIERAAGIFASTGDDSRNLVICLTAKQLNPQVRVVVRSHEPRNIEKIKKAGADAVISPDHIGGLRMGAEMFRPAVVSFLDVMLRDKEKNVRFEEIPVAKRFVGRPLFELKLWRYTNTIVVGLKTKTTWIYKPEEDYMLEPDNALVIITKTISTNLRLLDRVIWRDVKPLRRFYCSASTPQR